MNKYVFGILLLALMTIVACTDSNILNRLNKIKSVGDNEPEQAMLMYDSIRLETAQASEYVRMKGIMLETRLKDKAYITATSSDTAKLMINYFDENGEWTDALEAHYYAGSIYRDLKDMPNTIRNFLKAEEIATNHFPCDSVMLVNIYSNLVYAYFCVQDYANSLKMALKEYDTAKSTKALNIVTIIDVGENYLRLGDRDSAYRYYKEALEMAKSSKTDVNHLGSLYTLLYELSYIQQTKDADACYALIHEMGLLPSPLQLGKYFTLKNETNAAIDCYQSVLKDSNDLLLKYDAFRELYYLYKKTGNRDSINKYAELYIQMTDSIDLGKRQEIAASANNQYQYYRNVEEEARIKETNNRYKKWLYTAVISMILLFLIFSLQHMWRKNKHLKELLVLTEQLTLSKSWAESLRKQISDYKTQLENSEQSLLKTKQELDQVNNDISHYEEELKDKEKQLIEKLEENKRFILLLHKADLEERAEDIVKAIRNASEGKHKMTSSEWQKFYHAVDELQPDLSRKIACNLGKFNEQQQQVCYLLSIGLNNTQIENLTNIPHVTIWRWVKKLDWI